MVQNIKVSGPLYHLCVSFDSGFVAGVFFVAKVHQKSVLFPSVSLSHSVDAVRANFGQTPFRYSIEHIVADSLRKHQFPRLSKLSLLPSEIIHVILAALTSNGDEYKPYMVACSLVCRYWSKILSPYLFKTIKLRSKGDMDFLSTLIEQPGSCIPASLTHLTIHEHACDVWAHYVAMSLSHKFPNLRILQQERDYLTPFQWKDIQKSMPPSISGSIPALYSAYKGVTTFVLINHHFPSFAVFTQLVSALPVLETLDCRRVTWDTRPENPRLLRAPGRLSTLQVQDCDRYWQMIQLFTARWGRSPLDWEPPLKCPELNYNDSLLVHPLLNLTQALFPPVPDYKIKFLFVCSAEERVYKEITWDLTFSPCTFHRQNGLIKTCLTDLQITTTNSLEHFNIWILPLDELFFKAPLPFLANVTFRRRRRRREEEEEEEGQEEEEEDELGQPPSRPEVVSPDTATTENPVNENSGMTGGSGKSQSTPEQMQHTLDRDVKIGTHISDNTRQRGDTEIRYRES
ncbi:hypothetical protein PHLCEN_2v9780 [Hermanssonia centrifuga]|uniref:Uncharacterized protein n=1 Tax=Hermanssonia centrifuga TaxID=98765 RepID=A0A2R6NQI2_9APHY|nr:hypothetical protein PHLCEN_2v9780 [Hermanssonia centrifuga]